MLSVCVPLQLRLRTQGVELTVKIQRLSSCRSHCALSGFSLLSMILPGPSPSLT
jgi:hypothetical protein